MFRKLPPLHALAAFEAAARHQSFAKAAEELFLTHSAVSHRIRQLEESLGAKLFLRLNRSILLTPAGAQFLETVRETLHKLQSASSRLAADRRLGVRISVAPAFPSQWLAHRIGEFLAKHPTIDLEIQSNSHMVNLRTEDIDVGVRFGDGHWPDHHCVKLFSDEFSPVCSPAYLQKVAPIRAPQDLKRAVLLRNSKVAWKEWFDAVGLDWEEPRSGPLFAEVNLLLDAAASGAGVALAGRVLTTAGLRSGRLVKVLDATAHSKRAFYAVCLPEKLQRREVAVFVEWLAAEAREDLFKGTEAGPQAPRKKAAA